MTSGKQKYLTLKEMAEISGYTPDYLGQLIRSGKLPGKQIYTNVAWVATEDDLRAYLSRKKGSKTGDKPASVQQRSGVLRPSSRMQPRLLLTGTMYVAGALIMLFLALLFYVLATSLEHSLNQRAVEIVESRSGSL